MGSGSDMTPEDPLVAVFAVERVTGDAHVSEQAKLSDRGMVRRGF